MVYLGKTRHNKQNRLRKRRSLKYKHTRKYRKNRKYQKGGNIQLIEPEYESNPERTFNKVTYRIQIPGINMNPNYEFYFRITQTPNYIHSVNPEEPHDSCMFESFFVDKSNPNMELGHFSLSGLSYQTNKERCDIFNSGKAVSMGIGINENIRGGGLSRILIYIVTQAILQLYPSVREAPYMRNVYIDVDASGGFWDRIGMKPEKGFEREFEGKFKPLGAGYEKVTNFQNLINFGLGK